MGASPLPTFDINRLPPELCSKIMSSCDTRTMTALGSTSKFWNRMRSESIYYRVFELLKYFQLDPPSFLKFLKKTNSIISGSVAVLVFCPGLFKPGDLDIYCADKDITKVLDYFKTFTEYREVVGDKGAKDVEYTAGPLAKKHISQVLILSCPSPSGANFKTFTEYREVVGDKGAKDVEYTAGPLAKKHISQVLILSCPSPSGANNTDTKLINIIGVHSIPAISSISYFHSTPVMNFITGTGAVCLYPRLTLRMRGVINGQKRPWPSMQELNGVLRKYKERGFDLAFSPSNWKHNFAWNKQLKEMPICAVAFPKISASVWEEMVPREAAMDQTSWDLRW